MSMILSTFHHS